MQALTYLESGKMAWREIPPANLSEPHGALVRPTAVAMCDLDRSITNGASPFPGPFVLGHEFCGVVEQVGAEVTHLVPGDRVIASFQPSCGTCHQCGLGHSSVCTDVPNTSMYGIGQAGGDWGGALTDSLYVPWASNNLLLLPKGVDEVVVASGSDNLADGLRAVDSQLQKHPDSSVLIAGQGSIPLYAALCASFLGAARVTFASKDKFALDVAATLGAECLDITEWPKRLPSHDITFDCTGEAKGLSCVIKSTAPHGSCTSASIYFAHETTMPLRDMYMKGITFQTGRVNSAAVLSRVIDLVAGGLAPDNIKPAVVHWEDAIEALQETEYSQKLIIRR